MKRHGYGLIAIVVLAGAFTTVGCANPEKAELERLTQDYNALREERNALEAELAAAKANEADLTAQLNSAHSELNSANRELADTRTNSQPPASEVGQGWTRTASGDKITVGSDLLFGAGKADLTSKGKGELDKIARDLNGTYAGLPVRVYGHTDADPVKKTKKLWQDNLDLSANRAMAVTRYLIDKGVDGDRIETIAMGAAHSIADNKTAAGKAKNRRVEIVVIKAE